MPQMHVWNNWFCSSYIWMYWPNDLHIHQVLLQLHLKSILFCLDRWRMVVFEYMTWLEQLLLWYANFLQSHFQYLPDTWKALAWCQGYKSYWQAYWWCHLHQRWWCDLLERTLKWTHRHHRLRARYNAQQHSRFSSNASLSFQ